jgi:hypothetical protein
MCVPFEALREASVSICNVLFLKNVIGYVSIDYVVFITENNALKFWGVDIKLQLTNNSLIHKVFEVSTG